MASGEESAVRMVGMVFMICLNIQTAMLAFWFAYYNENVTGLGFWVQVMIPASRNE